MAIRMNSGHTVFSQIMAGLNRSEISRGAEQFPMARESKAMTVHDQFAAMVFAQLTHRESLRGIETCLSARRAVAYAWDSADE